MRAKDTVLAVVEAALWYGVIYYAFYSIKNPVDITQSALIILVGGYLAAWACPLIRNSDGWRRTFGNKNS